MKKVNRVKRSLTPFDDCARAEMPTIEECPATKQAEDFSRLDLRRRNVELVRLITRGPLSAAQWMQKGLQHLFSRLRRSSFDRKEGKVFLFLPNLPRRFAAVRRRRWAGEAVASAAISRPYQDTHPRKLVQSSTLDRADADTSPPCSSSSSSSSFFWSYFGFVSPAAPFSRGSRMSCLTVQRLYRESMERSNEFLREYELSFFEIFYEKYSISLPSERGKI